MIDKTRGKFPRVFFMHGIFQYRISGMRAANEYIPSGIWICVEHIT